MQASDIDRVRSIARSLRDAPHWPESAYLAAIAAHSQPQRIALVAEIQDVLGGFAVVSLLSSVTPIQAELETVAVADEFQRQGIARQILAALVREMKTAKVTEVALEVRRSNLPALALYRALGFAETGLRPRYYADPVEDAVLMTLAIDSVPQAGPASPDASPL